MCEPLLNTLLDSWAQSEPLDIGFIEGASGSFVAGTTGGVGGVETVFDLYDFEVGFFWYGGLSAATSVSATGNAYVGGVTGWSSFDEGGVANYAGAAVSFGGGVGIALLGVGVQGFAGEQAALRGLTLGGSIGPSLSGSPPVSVSGAAVEYTLLQVLPFHTRGPRQQTLEDALAFATYVMSIRMSPELTLYRSTIAMLIIRNGLAWDRKNGTQR